MATTHCVILTSTKNGNCETLFRQNSFVLFPFILVVTIEPQCDIQMLIILGSEIKALPTIWDKSKSLSYFSLSLFAGFAWDDLNILFQLYDSISRLWRVSTWAKQVEMSRPGWVIAPGTPRIHAYNGSAWSTIFEKPFHDTKPSAAALKNNGLYVSVCGWLSLFNQFSVIDDLIYFEFFFAFPVSFFFSLQQVSWLILCVNLCARYLARGCSGCFRDGGFGWGSGLHQSAE